MTYQLAVRVLVDFVTLNVITFPELMTSTILSGLRAWDRLRNRIVTLSPLLSLAVAATTSHRTPPMVRTTVGPKNPTRAPLVITLSSVGPTAAVGWACHTTRCKVTRPFSRRDWRAVTFMLPAVHDRLTNVVNLMIRFAWMRVLWTKDADAVVALDDCPELPQPVATKARSAAVPARSVRLMRKDYVV